MSQTLPVGGFEQEEDTLTINKRLKKTIVLIKSYDEESNEGFILEVDIVQPERLHGLPSELPFFPVRIKINK